MIILFTPKRENGKKTEGLSPPEVRHLQHPPQQKKSPPKLTCTCDNGSPTPYSRSYDLQTQTITFGEETNNNHTHFSNSAIVKKFSSPSPPSENKNHQKTFDMDAELEFYPVDDHPSPSTFTAWDAFLSGNQAFFREPPSDFSYMDVIPEEEDDMEASSSNRTRMTLGVPCPQWWTGSRAPALPIRASLKGGPGQMPPLLICRKFCRPSKAKKSKSDKIIPLIPPPSVQKKSYPTPNIPPRMSLHSPARRTRSDPGTPDTPSRIPRPISSSNRTGTSSPSSKNGPKALRTSETEENSKESTLPSKLVDQSVDATTAEVFDTVLISNGPLAPVEPETVSSDSISNDNLEQENKGTDIMLVEPIENGLNCVSDIANGLIEEDIVEECPTNPFFEEETNPFRINGESKNPFIKSNNPFEKENSEITPALQPKGQISAAVKAPPIPERAAQVNLSSENCRFLELSIDGSTCFVQCCHLNFSRFYPDGTWGKEENVFSVRQSSAGALVFHLTIYQDLLFFLPAIAVTTPC
ncbi:uncharacterized protein CEXT_312611 [Caerostris extrusa]|uniref:Uncharacterized protein n=1 Tax=Caerostris extrusa TaxID=172846 RepID=A0AAV4TG49_CAEEX|nr:uncharacterized protein CEXT_312611 [Caerostris extrusa]